MDGRRRLKIQNFMKGTCTLAMAVSKLKESSDTVAPSFSKVYSIADSTRSEKMFLIQSFVNKVQCRNLIAKGNRHKFRMSCHKYDSGIGIPASNFFRNIQPLLFLSSNLNIQKEKLMGTSFRRAKREGFPYCSVF